MKVELQHKGRASANMEPNRTRLCFYWELSSGNSVRRHWSCVNRTPRQEVRQETTDGERRAIRVFPPTIIPQSKETRPPLEGRGHAAQTVLTITTGRTVQCRTIPEACPCRHVFDHIGPTGEDMTPAALRGRPHQTSHGRSFTSSPQPSYFQAV